MDGHEQLFSRTYYESYLTWTILDIDQTPKNDCHESLPSIELYFDHDLFFEKLFIHIKCYTLISSNISLMTISNVINTTPCNVYNQTINCWMRFRKIIPIQSVTYQLLQSIKLKTSNILSKKAYSFTTLKGSRTIRITKLNEKSSKNDKNNATPTTKINGSKRITSIPKVKENRSTLSRTTTETAPMLTIQFNLRTTESSTTVILITTTAVVSVPVTIASTFGTSTTFLVLTMMTLIATATDTISSLSNTLMVLIIIIAIPSTVTASITEETMLPVALMASLSEKTVDNTSTVIHTRVNKTIQNVENISTVVLYTNINSTTSISSQPSSSLLYLLSAFSIIMICVITTSIWGFFRRNCSNNQHDIGDQSVNNMHNRINNTQYSIIDNDSKSSANWSHGSTLLLSTLVK